ncbi:MAG: hypothetical protein FJY76_03175 [Candidatus Aenigmarchaeota archaeon]|nr:hypothetical protein [Candidatus Aenigmarchaeota archaeon]
MPKWETHFALSIQRTGRPYKELHIWIDNNKNERGVDHRAENHAYTTAVKDFVFKKFGGAEAVSEWLFHVALDHLDTLMMNEWNFTSPAKQTNLLHFGFKKNGYIFFAEEEVTEEQMEKEDFAWEEVEK